MRTLPSDDRVLDLLGEIVSGEGGERARSELRGLVGAHEAEALIEEFELAAAAGELASMGAVEAMPASVRAKVNEAAAQFIAQQRDDENELAPFGLDPGRGAPLGLAVAGWLAAAACLAIAAVAWLAKPAPAPTPSERMAALERSAPDVIEAPLAGIDTIGAAKNPLDHGVSGAIVWSDAKDEGYIRVSGVEANDPSKFQYQLWIFDAERPTGDLPQFRAEGLPEILTQRPVDGGVFDIPAGGEAVIPIDAKLPIGKGVLFAVTKEPPGGVVVSDREIVFLALRG
ncbi:MAG: anti-sigma factor [Phycisphaerales bacterium]